MITPRKGGDGIAAHGPAFPQDDITPAVGEALSFGVEFGPDGNKRAHSIARPRSSSRSAARYAEAESSSSLVTGALLILAASAALWYASMRHDGQHPLPEPEMAAAIAHPAGLPRMRRSDPVAASRFARPAPASCDGRTRCPQMKSCEEAKFFTDNCPGAEMDGDGDGIPCESHWCTMGQASLQPPR